MVETYIFFENSWNTRSPASGNIRVCRLFETGNPLQPCYLKRSGPVFFKSQFKDSFGKLFFLNRTPQGMVITFLKLFHGIDCNNGNRGRIILKLDPDQQPANGANRGKDCRNPHRGHCLDWGQSRPAIGRGRVLQFLQQLASILASTAP